MNLSAKVATLYTLARPITSPTLLKYCISTYTNFHDHDNGTYMYEPDLSAERLKQWALEDMRWIQKTQNRSPQVVCQLTG